MIRLAVLGSTGSIGKNTLDVVRRNRDKFSIVALAARSNCELLSAQAEEFGADFVASSDEQSRGRLQELLSPLYLRSGRSEIHVACGEHALEQAATLPEVDVVIAAVSGFAGFRSVIAAIKKGKHIALANKETLVAGGDYVMDLAQEHGSLIVPVDSEHSSLFQCLQGQEIRGVARDLVLTASGGPFLSLSVEEMWSVTPEQAVKHPRWSMGKKISVDSATMMNKGLEVIEAARLFGFRPERIKVLVHPQSLVHGLVNFADGTSLAAMFTADMRAPIAYALSFLRGRLNGRIGGSDLQSGVIPLDLSKVGTLSFFPTDDLRFPALDLCKQALVHGGTCPAILSAANEIAVEAFLDERIRFPHIAQVVAEVLERIQSECITCYEQVVEADSFGRKEASKVIGALSVI